MCSFGASQDPIAAAECFRSAPHTLDHGESVAPYDVVVCGVCGPLVRWLPFRSLHMSCGAFAEFSCSPYEMSFVVLLLIDLLASPADDAARMCTDIPSAAVSVQTACFSALYIHAPYVSYRLYAR
jgi:hypothetical protein